MDDFIGLIERKDSRVYRFRPLSPYYLDKSWIPLLLDIEHVRTLWKSKTNRVIKPLDNMIKISLKISNNLKIFRDLAQKLSLPRPFVF